MPKVSCFFFLLFLLLREAAGFLDFPEYEDDWSLFDYSTFSDGGRRRISISRCKTSCQKNCGEKVDECKDEANSQCRDKVNESVDKCKNQASGDCETTVKAKVDDCKRQAEDQCRVKLEDAKLQCEDATRENVDKAVAQCKDQAKDETTIKLEEYGEECTQKTKEKIAEVQTQYEEAMSRQADGFKAKIRDIKMGIDNEPYYLQATPYSKIPQEVPANLTPAQMAAMGGGGGGLPEFWMVDWSTPYGSSRRRQEQYNGYPATFGVTQDPQMVVMESGLVAGSMTDGATVSFSITLDIGETYYLADSCDGVDQAGCGQASPLIWVSYERYVPEEGEESPQPTEFERRATFWLEADPKLGMAFESHASPGSWIY